MAEEETTFIGKNLTQDKIGEELNAPKLTSVTNQTTTPKPVTTTTKKNRKRNVSVNSQVKQVYTKLNRITALAKELIATVRIIETENNKFEKLKKSLKDM